MGIFSAGKFKLVLGIGLALQLVACTEKTYGPPDNKAPIETQPPSPLQSLEGVDPAGVEGLQPVETYNAIMGVSAEPNAARAEEIYQTVLRPIAAKILSKKTLSDRALLSSSVYYGYLRAMQEAIIKVVEIDPNHPGLKSIFLQYEELILEPCAAPQSSCAELKFVARDARYAFVTMHLTKVLKPSKEDAWRYLTYAMDFGMFPNSPEFSNFALNTMNEYLVELSKQPRELVREQLVRVKTVANQLVLSIQGRNETLPAFFERVDIWGEDIDGDQSRSILRETLWPVLIDGYAIVRGRPTTSFQGFAERQLAEFDTQVLGPFRTKPNWAIAFKNMNLSDLSTIDRTLLFVIDQAYRDRISVSDALSLLRTLSTSKDQLIAAAEQYVQIQFAYQVIRTQEELKVHLGDAEKFRTLVQFRQQLSKSQPLEIEWGTLQKRVTMLKGLIESQAAQGSALTSEDNRRLDKIFNKLDRNIKWSAIYPNMLPVIYYLSKANLSDTIQILWFKLKIDSELIFKLLFEGQFGGWFNFTNANIDLSAFSSAEVLLAFRNALVSGLFESYNIPVADFLKEATARLMVQTNVNLEINNQMIYDKMIAEYETPRERSYFSRAVRHCKGDPKVREEIELRDMTRYLAPFSAEFDGGVLGSSSSQANLHNLSLKSPDFQQDPAFNVIDFYRTDDMFMLDMIEKMVDMYKAYLKENGKEDPGIAEVESQLALTHQRFRKFYGMMLFVTEQFYSCQDIQRNLFKQRLLQVMKYEEIYVQRAFSDIKKVSENPALLEEVNATYRKKWPDVDDVENQDIIIREGDSFQFIFNKGDFVLRLREYFLRGVVDKDGRRLPAIAPKMIIRVPNDLLKVASGSDYSYFYKNQNFANVSYASGTTYEQFESDYLNMAFWDDSGDFMEPVVRMRDGRAPFVSWQDHMARAAGPSKTRLLFLSSFVKLGKLPVYDFDRPDCNFTNSFEVLEEKCIVEKQITVDYLLDHHRRLLAFAEITPEYQALFQKSKSPLLLGRYPLRYSFFNEIGWQPLGILDGFRFAMGREGLGGGVLFPGERPDDKGYRYPHTGYISRSIDYYRQIAMNGEPIIQPKEELSGHLKEMFQGYVDREWKPLKELEDLAAKETAEGRGTYSSNLIMNYAPFELPMFTGYSMPLKFLQRDLNQKTDFIFDRPSEP